MFKNKFFKTVFCYIPGLTPVETTEYEDYVDMVKSEIAKRKVKLVTKEKVSQILTKILLESMKTGYVTYINVDMDYHYSRGRLFKLALYNMLYWHYSSGSMIDIGIMSIFSIVYTYTNIKYLEDLNKNNNKILALINYEIIHEKIYGINN